jgi:hypothetical protein
MQSDLFPEFANDEDFANMIDEYISTGKTKHDLSTIVSEYSTQTQLPLSVQPEGVLESTPKSDCLPNASLDIQEPNLPEEEAEVVRQPRIPNPLNLFFYLKKPRIKKSTKNKPRHVTVPALILKPKKEYYREKLIRGHKRIIRSVNKGKFPKSTVHAVDNKNKDQVQAWTVCKAHIEQFNAELNGICETSSGPLTDGASHHKKTHGNDFKDKLKAESSLSFNNSYCYKYFANESVAESFRNYIRVIYAGMSPAKLCKKFGFNCCGSDLHTETCVEMWKALEAYSVSGLTIGKSTRKRTLLTEDGFVFEREDEDS